MTDVRDDESRHPDVGGGVHAYLFALTDAGGTVPPELGVVRRLVERGHRVTVLGDASMTAQGEATGADFRPWSESTRVFRDWELKNPLRLPEEMAEAMIIGPAPGQQADTAATIEEVRPDLVLTSFFAVGAMVAAEAGGVPFDVLIPNTYPLPAPGLPPLALGLKPARGPIGRARDRLGNAAGTAVLGRFTRERLNALRATRALPPLESLWEQMYRARRMLVLTSAAFDFPAELPPNARYVGAILDDPTWASDRAWSPPPGVDPLVLVAMSSTFQDHVGCLQRVADALGSLPVRGVLTTGPAVSPDAIRAPANVTVVASAPHREVLPHADLVVTHGGHGTVIKALAAGVPLVILSHGRDQANNAVRVTTRGAGVSISRRASSRRIARAIGRVLGDPAYRVAARRLGAQIVRDAEGPALMDELVRSLR